MELKNKDVLIPYGMSELIKFLVNNNFNYITQPIPVVSIISDVSYGVVYVVDDKYVFCKHKAMNINKNNNESGICSEIRKTFKIISKEEFEKYFRITNMSEIMILEMQEEKALSINKSK